MTEAEVDAHFAVTGDLAVADRATADEVIGSAHPKMAEILALADDAITPEAKAYAQDWAKRVLETAPTTVCTEHVPNEEKPTECAKCGKPLGSDEWEERIDAARASEERFDDGVIRVEGPRQLTHEEVMAAYTTPEERDAPLCAMATPDEFAALLDGPNVKTYELSVLGDIEPTDARAEPIIEPELPFEWRDGPEPELPTEPAGFAGMVEVSKMWLERADVLSKKRGMGLVPYLEWLIKRDWVASGGRGQ